MESLYLLIPVSVVLVFAIGAIFWWALRGGQMEDLEGPAYRILMDDDRSKNFPPGENEENKPRTFDADQ
jgi:cbb3-type cytochrome oxidase maturation protein